MLVANRDLMRAINRFAVLHAIRDAGSISRMDLAEATGLSRATVTGITAELLTEKMVLEKESKSSSGGRRPVPLTLNPQAAYTVGVHLGAHHVTAVLMDLQASILNTHTKVLEGDDYSTDKVVDTLIQTVQSCLWDAEFSRNQISGIGVAVPGFINSREGYVYSTWNYGWKDISLAEIIRQKTNVPVYVENSGKALVIFEQWFGVGRGTDNFLLITTEDGIGMGMVIDGKLYRGSRGVAGEFGHTTVDHNNEVCRCGNTGCLEAACSNWAILRDAQRAQQQGLWHRSDNNTPLTIEEVLEVAKNGNNTLVDIYKNAGEKLALGLNNLYKILDPEKIILSGKGVLAGNLLFDSMQNTLHEDISFAEGARVRLHVQEWKPTNYAQGAGTLVLQELYNSPANRVVPII